MNQALQWAPRDATSYEGRSVHVELLVNDEQMRRFAELSGDFNPLHTDEHFAKAKGFQGRVVYGALLLARISELVGMRLPGKDGVWACVELAFLRPLYVGQPALLEACVLRHSTSTGLLELSLSVRAEGKRIAKGRAEVVLVP